MEDTSRPQDARPTEDAPPSQDAAPSEGAALPEDAAPSEGAALPEDAAPADDAPQRVECPAAKDPAVRLFILAAMLLGFGAWCIVEVFVTGRYHWDPAGDINVKGKYLFNLFGAVVLPPGGLLATVWGIVFLRRTLVADQEGIGYVGKDKVAWGDVRSVDTSRFEKKGILVLLYPRDGEDKRLVLDGWKLQNFKDLLKLVETKLTI